MLKLHLITIHKCNTFLYYSQDMAHLISFLCWFACAQFRKIDFDLLYTQSYKLTTAFIIMAFNTIYGWYEVKQNVHQRFDTIIPLKFTKILIQTKYTTRRSIRRRLGLCAFTVLPVCCWIQWMLWMCHFIVLFSWYSRWTSLALSTHNSVFLHSCDSH